MERKVETLRDTIVVERYTPYLVVIHSLYGASIYLTIPQAYDLAEALTGIANKTWRIDDDGS